MSRVSAALFLVVLSGCGNTVEQRAASGALTGGLIGARGRPAWSGHRSRSGRCGVRLSPPQRGRRVGMKVRGNIRPGAKMRRELLSAAVISLALTGCGSTTTERVLTAGGTGLAAGGLAGGPEGAIIGGALGAILGAVTPTDGVTMTKNALGMVTPNELTKPLPPEPAPAAAQPPAAPPRVVLVTPDRIKSAQRILQQAGFYHARIDGIVGPQTERALLGYQHQQGLPETGRLDAPTLEKMNLHAEADGSEVAQEGGRTL
jgi:hypothetical protein